LNHLIWYLIASAVSHHLAPPVFIIAPPRSGSTFLFECLRRFEGMLALHQETDGLWWQVFPYQPPRPNDFVGAQQATVDSIRRIRRLLVGAAIRTSFKHSSSPTATLISLLRSPSRFRYLDKTIAHCFHLEFLVQAWPHARYIWMIRDPRANISSMIEGWPYEELVGKPQLTPHFPAKATISHWSYPAPPAWREQVHRPLANVCAWSWQQHIEFAQRFFAGRTVPVFRLRYEDLVQDPAQVIRQLANDLNLSAPAEAIEFAIRRPISRTTISPPSQDKWQRLHQEEITSVLPQIRETARQIGYEL